jgi:protein TonB
MTAITAEEPIKPGHDKLGFTLCLAMVLHAAIILGISFNQLERNRAAPKLEITLAQYRSHQAPEEADYLAQHNQTGSGTLEEKKLITSEQQSLFQDTAITPVSPQQEMSRPQQEKQRAQLNSTDSQFHIARQQSKEAELKPQHKTGDIDIEKLSQEIASLEARLDIQNQAYTKRPRVRRLTSVSAKQSIDALYLHHWRSKIEDIGNRNYPAIARRDNILGELRLLVALLPNGDVHKVRILSSSGHPVLDKAAVKIVYLAAPYDPFPRALAAEVDVLEIIRTWRFQKNRLISSS